MLLNSFRATYALTFAILFITACKQQMETEPIPGGPKVPEGYTVEVAAGPELLDFPMFATLDETGRLFVFESIGNVYDKTADALKDPKFRIKLLLDINADGKYDSSIIFADKVGFPQGGVFIDGSLYASSAPDLLKLTDTDKDGKADKREVILSGWTLNVNANSLVGPVRGPDGWLYMTSAIEGFDVTSKEGKRMKGETARTWRLRTDGSKLEWISAGGMNNPVELTFTEAGEPIGTETYFTEPRGGERDALVYWTEGGVYPKPNSNIDRDSLVRTGELMPVVSKYSRVAPSGIARYRNNGFGEDFRNNLFSAQFNTHRVIRHKLFRSGGSFRTEDEVFFSSDNEDFHPTDVLEDADGSLLVVETGGWFIKGCPLSQVSKPELKGSIYRVRRSKTDKIKDPYGNEISWKTATVEELSTLLESERPFVADRAMELLIKKKNASVDALAKQINYSTSTDVRTKAIFALYRINSAESLTIVRSGLSDQEIQVRVAAARVAGLARDGLAIAKLTELILRDSPAVQRQAATALGQIGNPKAITALLNAADTIADRFVEHSIIYSLVELRHPEILKQGINNPSATIQKVALIALDQQKNNSIKASDLTPFLNSPNIVLRNSALWVAGHHPDWAPEIVGYLTGKLNNPTITEGDLNLYQNIMVAFSKDPQMQAFIAAQYDQPSKARKLFILSTMASSNDLKEFPAGWSKRLGKELLTGTDPGIKSKALSLIRQRGIGSFAADLKQFAEDNHQLPELRMDAIAALVKLRPVFSSTAFNFLISILKTSKEPGTRQEVADILVQGKLTEPQIQTISTDILPIADAFLLPRLLPIFQGKHTTGTGQALISKLLTSPGLDNYSQQTVDTLFALYPKELDSSITQLKNKVQQAQAGRLQRLREFEADIFSGDLDRGRKLFYGKALCSTCHSINQQGGSLGPDLTSIQKDRSAHDLLEAIVYPSASFVRSYETYQIKTKSASYTGVIKEKTSQAILLANSPLSTIRIPREDIVSTELLDNSMMPQNLDKMLTKQEIADLMTFLLGQDQDPDTDQRILR